MYQFYISDRLNLIGLFSFYFIFDIIYLMQKSPNRMESVIETRDKIVLVLQE